MVPNLVESVDKVWTWLKSCGVALTMLSIEMLLVLSQLSFLIFTLVLHLEHLLQ